MVSTSAEAAGKAAKITTQPKSQTVNDGDTTKFKVVASNAAKYQWQRSKDNGKTWENCTGGVTTNATLSVEGRPNRDGRLYRCRVKGKDGGYKYSSAAKLTVKTVSITSQPQSVSAMLGKTVKFTISASLAKGYQWQYSKDGVTWKDLGKSVTGAKDKSISFTAWANYSGNWYRCIVKGVNASKTSNSVRLTVEKKKDISIMSFNVLNNDKNATITVTNKKGEKVTRAVKGNEHQYAHPADREAEIVKMIKNYAPDVICFQETNSGGGKDSDHYFGWKSNLKLIWAK